MNNFYNLSKYNQKNIINFLKEIERTHDWVEYYKQFIDNQTEELIVYVEH